MTLLSLASRQIWPQVLAVLYFRPTRLVLFHSGEEGESKRPAERLKKFFEQSGLLSDGVQLSPVPHDSFSGLMDRLAAVAEASLLDGSNCRLNLTGGNKLMAMAAAEWSRLNGVPCFYLERDLRVFPFLPVATELKPQSCFTLDPQLAKDLDPVALLRCQLDAAEIVSAGERLTLSPDGKAFSEAALRDALRRGQPPDPWPLLLRAGDRPRNENVGDDLELLTAVVLLRLGVPVVQRGIRLKSGSGRGHWQDEGELDLVFNWSGKLWIVDCKHRRSAESRMATLRNCLASADAITVEVEQLLAQVTDELRDKELKPLKEDLLTIAESGGLLGRALAVRVTRLPQEAAEFARSRGLPIVLRSDLVEDLGALLHPSQAASMDALRALAKVRTRAAV